MTKNGPSMQRFSRELAVTALPLAIAIVLLGLFTVPNYLRARAWSREANALRAVANESAARQDNLLDMQREIERLRSDLAQRGRTLPATPDQGALLASIARSADAKGVTGSQSKSGKLAPVAVSGLAGGKAMRRTVDVEMTGSFDALFAAVSNAERLDALVTVRSIDLSRNPAAEGGLGEAKLVVDEYFNERAAEPRASAARTTAGKAGG